MRWFINASRQRNREIQQYRQRLYRVAYAWCHDPQLADDLVQETLKKAISKQHQLNTELALHAWLFSILTNCWRDYWRKHRETLSLDSEYALSVNEQDYENERMMIVRDVRKAISELAQDQRQIITLIDLEDMSYADVAKILSIPIGTVMSRLCRARRVLKEILQKMHSGTDTSAPNLWRVK